MAMELCMREQTCMSGKVRTNDREAGRSASRNFFQVGQWDLNRKKKARRRCDLPKSNKSSNFQQEKES